MKYLLLFFLFTFSIINSQGQTSKAKSPRLVVGIVIDQMRWDYLYRFSERYKEDGAFKRLIREGFQCKNTQYNYVPTVTAVGHSSIYSGTTPAIHGIVGNDWYDRTDSKKIYCTNDKIYGSSPKNLMTTTITDELRMAHQFKNKVYGVALKNRASIFPAGHNPSGTFWYDTKTGNWVSSTYYGNLPSWINDFNNQKMADTFYKNEWTTLYPISSYVNYGFQKTMLPYYNNPFSKISKSLPYKLSKYIKKDYQKIASTPWGNNLTISFAKSLIENENLGKSNNMTDFLAVSFSSTDYVGHAFGPNSVEIEDTYLRLDRDLGNFIDYLDKRFGKDYLLFLTADHAVNNIPEFLKQHKMPGGNIDSDKINTVINDFGKRIFRIDSLVEASQKEQIYFNTKALNKNRLKLFDVIESVKIELTNKFPNEIAFVINNRNVVAEGLPHPISEKIINSYCPSRSGDLSIILKSGYLMSANPKGTSHSTLYSYDTHVPLLFYGWRIPQGSTSRLVDITDIAPTVAQLLNIESPSGCIGSPITEVIR